MKSTSRNSLSSLDDAIVGANGIHQTAARLHGAIERTIRDNKATPAELRELGDGLRMLAADAERVAAALPGRFAFQIRETARLHWATAQRIDEHLGAEVAR